MRVVQLITLIAMLHNIAFSQSTYHNQDNLNRIDSISYPDGSSVKIIYDKSGNILSKVEHSICDAYASPTITGSSKVCVGDSVQLTSTSAYKYLWNTGDTSSSIWVKAAGNYSVNITYSNDCERSSSQFKVAQLSKPVDWISVNRPGGVICVGDSITLSTNGLNTYLWSTGATTKTIHAKDSGLYTVLITSTNGCTDSKSQFVTVNFPTCIPPFAGITAAATSLTATINWTVINCAQGYQFQYRVSGSSNWTNFYVLKNSGVETLKKLTPGTTYEYHIATKCSSGPDVYSDFSPNFTFTTPLTGVAAPEAEQKTSQEPVAKMVVQPNPNIGNFVVVINASTSSEGVLSIYNSLGKTVYYKSVSLVRGQNTIQIDVKSVSAGVYFIKLKTDKFVNTQKIVKQ